MEQFAEGESTREEIKNKLRQNFDGKSSNMGTGYEKSPHFAGIEKIL